jgi:hypothetical protein
LIVSLSHKVHGENFQRYAIFMLRYAAQHKNMIMRYAAWRTITILR